MGIAGDEFVLDTPVVRAFVADVRAPRDDIHRVRTASAETSVSLDLVSNDTGCVWRHAYHPKSGAAQPFRSGYANVDCEPGAG